MGTSSNMLPGHRTGIDVTPLDCLWRTDWIHYGSGVIDATYAYDGAYTSYEWIIRPGTPLAKITASGLWVPCKRTLTTLSLGAGTTTTTPASSSQVVVDDARAFVVGDTITVGADTGNTITAIDYTTNTITIDNGIAWADGEAVFASGALAGAEICRGILNERIVLKNPDNTSVDKTFSLMVIAGFVDYAKILGDYAAIRAATNYLSHIIWNDYQGQV